MLSDVIELTRINRPLPILLILLPCWWGTFFARDQNTSWLTLSTISFVFLVGAITMRSAGCVWNDILDRNIDRFVERTKNRPLASQSIQLWTALVLFIILCGLGFLILMLFNTLSIMIGFIGVLIMLIYPLSKRCMKRPQLVLGLGFNIGVLLGYSQITRIIDISSLLLYISGIYWTMIYDTIYAYQDKVYDERLGLNSTAVLYGQNGKKKMLVFTIMMTFCLFGVGLYSVAPVSMLYYIVVCLVPISLIRIIRNLNIDDVASCKNGFAACITSGFIVLLGCVVSKL